MPLKFTLVDFAPELPALWREAFQTLVSEECRNRVTILEKDFTELDGKFDCVVSPANSFGRFDGGFDQVLSDVLAPARDRTALTRTAQSFLYERWRGFAPPGTCTLIPLANTPCEGNRFSCQFVALCPTMRTPRLVDWHKDLVYNCVWSLLVAIDAHNVSAVGQTHQIESVVMTGLGTGTGGYSPRECAKQTALAFAHFEEAKARPDKWSSLSWRDIANMPLRVSLPSDIEDA
ncbi:macro domain-like protein [Trametes meyenii]|nr:macro domain-like protein [Trametes meyenii]